MELAGAKWAWESLGATVQHALQAAQTKAATFLKEAWAGTLVKNETCLHKTRISMDKHSIRSKRS